jgi:hypothetical protein
MKRSVEITVCLTLLLAPAMLRAADAAKPAAPAKEAAELVRQLSDESFEVRDAAVRRLTELGKAAEAALRLGTTAEDAEVRRQCQLLLERATRSDLTVALDAFLEDRQEKHVLQLPAWGRFSKLAGTDPAAKALFVEICCTEAALMDALEKDPNDASKKFAARSQQLQQALFNRGGPRASMTLGQVAALLFIATDSRLQLDAQAQYPIYTLVNQPQPREGFQNNRIARKLLVTYLEGRTDPNLLQQNLYMVMNLNLKESVGWAVKVAKDKNAQPYARSMALGVVGKLGSKDNIVDLEPFLTDTTPLGQTQVNMVRIQAEMRDVALAMLVQLSGQQLEDYGFPYLTSLQPGLRGNQQVIFFSPSLLGFSDAASRDAALKRWKDWSEAAKKK